MAVEMLSLPDTPTGPQINFDNYHSVYEFRYSSNAMRHTWSENHKLALMREVWVAVAGAQQQAGLITDMEYGDLLLQEYNFDFATVHDRETNVDNPRYEGHDVLAAISEYADRAQTGGGKIHQGMTSEDVLSNVEVMQMHEALDMVEQRLVSVLEGFGSQIEKFKATPIEGYTHLQAAEPLTLGLRLGKYAQNFVMDLIKVRLMQGALKGKGIKGPVGTSAGIQQLLEGTGMSVEEHENIAMEMLGLEAFTITDQTYPRKQLAEVLKVLSGIGTSSFVFANNMRLMQSSPWDEVAEPRAKNDKGSSAMPHKRNPRHAENIMGLARGLKYKAAEAEEIASAVPLERGIDDSSGKRSLLPESFLAVDEILGRLNRVVRGLDVHEDSIWRNLEQFAPFTATEQILSKTTKKGADRQKMHKILFDMVSGAIKVIQRTGKNPLQEMTEENETIMAFMKPEEVVQEFMDATQHTGNSEKACTVFLEKDLYPAIGKAA